MIDLLFLAAGDDPASHVKDVILLPGDWHPGQFRILTMHMVTLIVAGIATVLLLMLAGKAIATGPESEGNDRYITKGRFAQVIEAMVVYLRDEMLVPVLGDHGARKFLPFLLTLFFFILCNNLIGIIPFADLQHLLGIDKMMGGKTWFGGTATSNIAITAGLAIIAGLVIVVNGFIDLGPKEFFKHMTGGLVDGPPVQVLLLSPVILIVFFVEILGLFIKPTALAIRLFANMVAGHILLAVLLSFGYAAVKGAGGFGGTPILIWGVTGIASLLIFFLEVFVAFLQAFIFMFLTAVFVSLLMHHDDHDHEEAHDGHDDIAVAAEEAQIA